MADTVWAKIRYCPYWPARIIENPPPEIGEVPVDSRCVYFFGSHNFGFPRTECVLDYSEHRSKYIKKWRGKLFKDSIEECDEYLSKPIDSHSNGPLDAGDQIVVKRELDFNVKIESNEDPMYETEVIQVVHPGTSCDQCHAKQVEISRLKAEKQNIAENLVATKKEHQQTYLVVQQKERELRTFDADLVAARNECEIRQAEINRLKAEKQNIAENLVATKKEHQKTYLVVQQKERELRKVGDELIASKSECETKQAEIEKLESELLEIKSTVKDNVYEVEKILKHSKMDGKMSFFVSWTGYGKENNSWVPESDLLCDSLLRKYKKRNGIK